MSSRDFKSYELVELEETLNKLIEENQYQKASDLIKTNSQLYEFEFTISNAPPSKK